MACFADVNVSQGSVATYARCGKIFNIKFNYKFTRQSPRENFYKIRLDFTELWPQICGPTFLAHPVCVNCGDEGHASASPNLAYRLIILLSI